MAAKRTRKPLVWALCLHATLAFGQSTFQKTFGGPGNEVGTWLIESANGYLVAGHVTSTTGNQDALLIRLDASGNSIWQKRFGGAQADVFNAAVETTDGFLAVGETRSYGAESADIFIVKVDPLGSAVWSKTIGESFNDDLARSVISLPGGGFLVSGISFPVGSTSPSTIFLRLDQNGNTVWSRTITSNVSNILYSNYVEGNVIYASGGLDADGAFMRLDLTTGNILSSNLYAGSGTEALYYQQPTQDGNLVIADHTHSAPTGVDVEVWVQKIKPATGQLLWSKVYYRANDNLRGRIEKVNDGGFLLVPYDNFNTAQADALLAKIDANGNLLWSYNYGGNASDRLFKAVQTTDGGFIAVGDTRSSSANGNSDILLVKTNANGRIEGACAKDAGIQVANFYTDPATPTVSETSWLQTMPLNVAPLPLNLLGQTFQPNGIPTIFQNIPLCPNKSYSIGGVAYFAPKLVSDTITNANGCDTIYNYNLELIPFNPGIHVIGLCPGQPYEIDGVQYYAPATVLDTIPSITGGCDTLCTFVLKMLAQPTAAQTINFCSGESVMIGSQVYNQPGTVQANIPSSTGGCDTLVTYTLTEIPLPTSAVTINFCSGESVMIGGNTYNQSGTVVANVGATNGGCDTVVTYTLVEQPLPTYNSLIRFCPGETITIGGNTYSQSETVVATLASATGGCDTIATYILELLPQPTRAETLGFCPGESVTISGQVYNQPGTVVANIASTTGGCDTIVTYTLELRPQPTRAETRGFCPGESVTIAGQVYNQPGTVVANIISTTGGCDTIVTYTLELYPQATRAETRGFCPGESVTIAGQVYDQPGTVVANIASTTGGCDTIVTYTLQHLTPAPSNVSIHCPSDIAVTTVPGSGPAVANYSMPIAASDCICPGLDLSMQGGLPSGSMFPVGTTQVCYLAKDRCGQQIPCCFNVTIREEQPCDVKVNGCMKYELLSITSDPEKNYTYRIRVTNNCSNKLIYTAIQVPDGVIAIEPTNNSTYTSPKGSNYLVRSPNYSPMYSIRFKSTADSIANGESDIFEYTLPAQANVTYINITSRLATQVFYEAHLNTFNCPIGVTPSNQRQIKSRDEGKVEDMNSTLLYPNPTTGVLYADLSDWEGQKLQIQVTTTQGQTVHSLKLTAQDDLLRVEMPAGLSAGVYFFELTTEKGEKETLRFVLQR